MMILHKLEMDLQQRGVMPGIDVVQGDANTRVLELTLCSGGEDWQIPADAVVWMRYCKEDGTKGVYDTLPDGSAAWSVQGNVLNMTLAPQMLTAAGTVLAQIQMVQGERELAGFAFRISVERNVAEGAVKSEDYVNMLRWMEAELAKLLTVAKESGEFDGPQGPVGKSAYEYAQAAGYEGTEAEFTDLLLTPCLPLAGGTMRGAVNMGGKVISNLHNPGDKYDAVTKQYVDSRKGRSTVTLPAAAWPGTAPYILKISVTTVGLGDVLVVRPVYTGNLTEDLTIKTAYNCIDTVEAANGQIVVMCLEAKPKTDLTVIVDSFH